jgi:hypothetical protein
VSIRPPSRRHPARRAAWLAAALAFAGALPGVAGAAGGTGTSIAIYLPSADTLTKDEASDVEAVLVSGLHQAARGGTISVREPTLLRPSCGRNPSDACLAGLAGDGAVLISRARRDGIHVVVSMALVNGKGRRTRWTSFVTTLTVQDARPCAQALYFLEDELSRPGSGAPHVAAPGRGAAPEPRPGASAPPVRAEPPAPPPVPAPVAAAPAAAPTTAPAPAPEVQPTPAPVAAAPPPRPAPAPSLQVEPPRPAQRPVVVRAPRPPPPPPPAGSWSTGRVAGAWTAGGGLLVAAVGGYAALQARTLDARLTDRFEAGTLTPADAPTYGSVRRWNRAANVLLVAGGVVTAGGATLFFLSPTVEPLAGGGVAVGLAGRF